MKFIVGFAVPALIIGISVPLVFGVVAPNGLYGFRTPRTLSSPHIWYRANRAAGWFMIAAGLLVISVNSVLLISHPDWSENKLVLWMANSLVVGVVAAAVASFAYLRKL